MNEIIALKLHFKLKLKPCELGTLTPNCHELPMPVAGPA